MITIFIIFLVGYFFHLAYKLIDKSINLLRRKRYENKGDIDNV